VPQLLAGKKAIGCRLIVFDKDGTLIDQYPLFLERAQARRKAISQCAGEEAATLWERIVGVDLKDGRIDQEGPLAMLSRKDEMLVAALCFYLTGSSWNASKQLTEETYQRADASLVPPYGSVLLPNVERVLVDLREKGFRFAIASTDNHDLIEKSLRVLGLGSLFDAIAGADDVINGKPSPDMVNEIMKQTRFGPEETVVVGDSENDMRMGRNAKVKACIAVLTGSGRREKLEPLADIVINSVAELSASTS
jgi:phosphoglycolate phosphatase